MNNNVDPHTAALRRAVGFVAMANIAYFFVEFSVATAIGSVSLFADSIDFLEDASVNFLILLALGWPLKKRARLGMALAGILMAPGIATLWMAAEKLLAHIPPNPIPLSITGLGALAVNLTCALMLAHHRHHKGSITKAAFLSARNDVLANVAIILAGFATALTRSVWPDFVVGIGIAVMNANAAHEVWTTARKEHLEADNIEA